MTSTRWSSSTRSCSRSARAARVQRRACYLALGRHRRGRAGRARDVVPGDRGREVLDAGPHRAQAARRRTTSCICCVDGLKGFPEAIEAIYPQHGRADLHRPPDPAQPQVRAAARARAGRPRPEADLHRRRRRRRPGRARGLRRASGAARFPVITQAWLNAWEYVIPFLAFPPELRRVVYTTNAIEALNRQLRKAIKTKGHFPNEEAAQQADLPRHRQRRAGVDTNAELDDSPARVQDPLRRSPTRVVSAYTKTRTPSKYAAGMRAIGSRWRRLFVRRCLAG